MRVVLECVVLCRIVCWTGWCSEPRRCLYLARCLVVLFVCPPVDRHRPEQCARGGQVRSTDAGGTVLSCWRLSAQPSRHIWQPSAGAAIAAVGSCAVVTQGCMVCAVLENPHTLDVCECPARATATQRARVSRASLHCQTGDHWQWQVVAVTVPGRPSPSRTSAGHVEPGSVRAGHGAAWARVACDLAGWQAVQSRPKPRPWAGNGCERGVTAAESPRAAAGDSGARDL